MFSPEFLITALVVVLIPGTGVIYTVSTGIFNGKRSSIAAAFGCTAGIIPHLIAGILGLSALMHMSALVFQVIKFAGVLYLLYLAWGMWQDKGSIQFEEREEKRSLQVAKRAVLINILNPKLTIFFLAFLPQFLNHNSPVHTTVQLLGMSLVFMVMTLAVFLLYGLLGSAVRSFFVGSKRRLQYMQRSFAVVFAVLGAKLALSE